MVQFPRFRPLIRLRDGLCRLRGVVTDKRGNVAMIFALAAPVLALIVGFAIDLSRHQSARSLAQDAVDASALAAAASTTSDLDALTGLVNAFLAANVDPAVINAGYVVDVRYENETELKVTLKGDINAYFSGLIGMSKLPVNVEAVAQRGSADAVELALVLDNTWSMSDAAGSGQTRIQALKTAARTLTDALMARDDGRVKIGVVPYAEYVNIGVANRTQNWVSVPANYSTTTPAPPRVCETRNTKSVCTGGVRGVCTRYNDGVPEDYACWTTPQTCTVQTVAPYQYCTGGGNPTVTNYSWYGCVRSRNKGSLRLNDSQPDTAYVGFLGVSQRCLNPIMPLNGSRNAVTATIDALVVNVGAYRPNTHIPSGLIWGVNVLSPTAPFTDARAYSPGNSAPRKILVLMTDGENTLRYQSSDGQHVALSTNAVTAATQLTQTNKDVSDICTYARGQGIEIYTVALAVDSSTARTMLQNCATDAGHYFDASDSGSLVKAFADIAASINAVRLVK